MPESRRRKLKTVSKRNQRMGRSVAKRKRATVDKTSRHNALVAALAKEQWLKRQQEYEDLVYHAVTQM